MIKNLFTIYKKHNSSNVKYILLFVLLLIISCNNIITAHITSKFIDGLVERNKTLLLKPFIIGIVAFFLIAISKYFNGILLVELTEKMKFSLRTELLTTLKNIKLNYLSKLTEGELQYIFTKDVDEITKVFFSTIFQLSVPFIITLISFIYLFNININIALLVTLFSIILAYVFEKLRVEMKELFSSLRNNEVEYLNFHQNIVNGIKIIMNYEKEDYFLFKNDSLQENLSKSSINIAKLKGFGYGFALFLVYIIQIVAIVMGFFELKKDTITCGQLVAIMTLVGNIVSGFASFGNNIAEMQKSLISVKKIMELLAQNVTIKNPIVLDTTTTNLIEFKNVCFSYDTKLILNNINFSIKKREKILIKGLNGEGKSTIIKLILGFLQPTQGQILLSEKMCEYLPTNDHIFTGSLLENIFFKENITDEEKDMFLKLSTILSFNFSLNDDIKVHALSGGELQKLKLIRYLIKDKDIYLFDEPTKGLDKESRKSFKKYLQDTLKEKTILIIDHTDSFLDCIDTIYELKNSH